MIDNALLEKMIKEVMYSMEENKEQPATTEKMTKSDYPLSEKHANFIKTPTGKYLSEITIEGVMSGQITTDDVKIAPETLEYQAQIAESVGRVAFARNLRRAAELIVVPDNRILEIYNALRPYRSTKLELIAIAEELENQYSCKINAKLVREAAELYERRDKLKE